MDKDRPWWEIILVEVDPTLDDDQWQLRQGNRVVFDNRQGLMTGPTGVVKDVEEQEAEASEEAGPEGGQENPPDAG